ncbi:MAG: hypothetical protein KDN20_26005 [Verrucomicrobiae bacterium]|nr:hypothetical protein [Verrucomicrobiae bacterium]
MILACLACKGEKKADVNDLRDTFEAFQKEHPFLHLEDPLEDVFTSYIVTPVGGWISFSGIFADGPFWVQRLLNFLEEKTDYPTFREILDSSLALVKLTDATALRVGLVRYSQGGGTPKKITELPDQEILLPRKDSVIFSNEELLSFGVERDSLEDFNLSEERRSHLLEEDLLDNALERFPILLCEGYVVLIEPSQVCRAVVRSILHRVSMVMRGWADTFFEKESAEFFVNEVLRRLEIDPIRVPLPAPPESLPDFWPVCGQFDFGKPVLGLTFAAKLSEGAHLEQALSLDAEQVPVFETYIAECCAALSNVEGFTGGMILMNFSALGRDLLFGFNEIPEHWHFFGGGLGEWGTLRNEKGFDAFRLWRLGEQLDHSESLGVHLSNWSGLANLYAYWKSNGFLIIPQNYDLDSGQLRLSIASNFCHDLNVELRRRPDAHCRLNHSRDRWTHLQRINSGHHPDFDLNRIYGDVSSVRDGVFLGCSESSETVWWVECSEEVAHEYSRDCKFQLWECLLNWTDAAAQHVEELVPERFESVLVRLHLPNIDEWAVESLPSLEDLCDEASHSVDLSVDPDAGVITLSIPQAFIREFHRPANDAERALLHRLVEGVVSLSGSGDFQKIDAIVETILPNPDARHFHVLKVEKLENILARSGNAKVRYIPTEAVNNLQLGLADTVGRLKPKDRTNRESIVKFLTKLVEKQWEQIEAGLAPYDLASTVNLCFQQLDEINVEKSRWESTTRALLALHANEPWIVDRIREKRENLSLAEIANRLLIEIAVYSGASVNRIPISLVEHSQLTAKITVLLDLANYRDSIAGGFMKPEITIHPNGAIEVDRKFFEDVFSPYIRSHVDDQISFHAENYESYFSFEKETDADPASQTMSDEGKRFLRVFEEEFGFRFDVLGDALEMFHERAMETRQSLVLIASQDLKSMISRRSGISSSAAAHFIERFTLPIRKGWNKDLGRFRDRDVFPWCHRRSFSILSRPMIQIDKSPSMLMVSVTHLHRWFQYFLNNLESGYFPEHHFRAKGFRKHLGEIANRRGHSFARSALEKIEGLGIDCQLEVALTALGAPASPDLGDIDVFAWDKPTGRVFLIECKRLRVALTARDVIQRLDEFRGEAGDQLGKHIARVEWISENLSGVSKVTGIPQKNLKVVPILLTNDRVPMKFMERLEFPSKFIVPIQDIETIFHDSFH